MALASIVPMDLPILINLVELLERRDRVKSRVMDRRVVLVERDMEVMSKQAGVHRASKQQTEADVDINTHAPKQHRFQLTTSSF